MSAEKVSIVVPTYNRAERLEALASVFIAQDYRPLELIIVNDGSDDGTEETFRSLRNGIEDAGISTVFCTIPHSGQDAALSEGLKHVTGDYLFWFDDDDSLTPDAISCKVEWLRCHPEDGFVRSEALRVEEESGKVLGFAHNGEHLKGRDIIKYLLDDTMPCFPGIYLMRTSLLDWIYPDRTIPLNGEGQNLQLLIPAALVSGCGFIDKVQMHYMVHPDSHSSKGRSLTELLARNEKFRELKLYLVGPGRPDLAEIINARHDLTRRNILMSAAVKARSERQS